MNRRSFIHYASAQTGLFAMCANKGVPARQPRIAVIGGGVFGVWTAWYARLAGADVTLIDAYSPGHARASSGGETRQLHQDYADPVYAALASRATGLWRHWEKQWNTPLFHRTGRLLLGSKRGAEQITESHKRMQNAGIRSELLSPNKLRKRWPQIEIADVRLGVHMPSVGLLAARRACATVAHQLQRSGGALRIARVEPGAEARGKLSYVRSHDKNTIRADIFIFACGPWLPKLFPDLLGTKLRPVRRDVFFIGPPAGDARFSAPQLPSWSFRGAANEPDFTTFYGFPDLEGRGFKICPVNETNTFDPDHDSRLTNPYQAKRAREFVARRFPALARQPMVETRVCQVTDSIGGHFLVDRHPRWQNVWLVGGGAGHGFKHGPALGQYVAHRVLEQKSEPDFDARFRLNPGRLQFFQRD